MPGSIIIRPDFEVEVKNLSDDYSQIALQGRNGQNILKNLTDLPLDEMGSFAVLTVKWPVFPPWCPEPATPGEDGFEVYTTSPNPSDHLGRLDRNR